jgi:hypothetical protein
LVEQAETLFGERFPDVAEVSMRNQAFAGLRAIIRSRGEGNRGLIQSLATSHWLQNVLHNEHLAARYFKRGWTPKPFPSQSEQRRPTSSTPALRVIDSGPETDDG